MIYEIKKALEAMKHPGIKTNIFNMVKNALPYYVSPAMNVRMPLTIYWAINSICDLKCKMCDVGTKNYEGTFYKNLRIDKRLHQIDIDVFKSVIDEAAQYKPFIAINSTEPLLYKPLTEAIEYCSQKGLETAVTTGGYSLPKVADDLAMTGLKRLNVSLDGPPSIHNEIRRRPDSFERSIEGINAFHEISRTFGLKNQIYVNYVITNMNYQYLVDFADSIKGLPIDNINYTYLWVLDPEATNKQNQLFGDKFPVSTSCFNEFTNPSHVNTSVLFEQIKQLRGRVNVEFLPYFSRDELIKYYKEPDKFIKKDGRCLASWFIVQVLANGNVIPYSRCHNESLGNINEQPFESIWNGQKMKNWRRFIKKHKKMPMCKRCDLIF